MFTASTAIYLCKEECSNEQISFVVNFKKVNSYDPIRSETLTVGPLSFNLELFDDTLSTSVVLKPTTEYVIHVVYCTVSARMVNGVFSTPAAKLQFRDVVSNLPIQLYSVPWRDHDRFFLGKSFAMRITVRVPGQGTKICAPATSYAVDRQGGLEYDRAGEHSLSSDLERVVASASTTLPMGKVTIAAGSLNAEENLRCEINALTLAARSPVFRTMLTSSMQEATTHETHITDFSPEAVVVFVRFLHTDRCSHADLQAHTPHLLQLADKYQVPALGAVCAQYKRGALSCENALGVLKLADRCNAREVRQEALRFIAEHAGELGKRGVSCLEDVSAELLGEILVSVSAVDRSSAKTVTVTQDEAAAEGKGHALSMFAGFLMKAFADFFAGILGNKE